MGYNIKKVGLKDLDTTAESKQSRSLFINLKE